MRTAIGDFGAAATTLPASKLPSPLVGGIRSEVRALRIAEPQWLSADMRPSFLTRMRKPACYGLMMLRLHSECLEQMEFAMSSINRRALLFLSASAGVASTVAAEPLGPEPPGEDPEPSDQLRTLIEVHEAAYSSFGEALREMGGGGSDSASASREEERALLSICSYAAAGEGDRLAKARYLLEIEARGELDLAEHMQAVLRSTMWK